jgi:sugar phosphate isomerase/epimerase
VHAQLRRFAGPVRRRAGRARLGLGLWLAREAAAALDVDAAARRALREALDAQDLYVFTLNGFPVDAFHAPRVKEAVYRPDWTSPQRLEHTRALARVLAALLPDGVEEGTISTLPLADVRGFTRESRHDAVRHLTALCADLARLRDATGRAIRVCLEPEPECAIETAAQAVRFFADVLPRTPHARAHLGLCWDCCHAAVAFEDTGAALAALAGAGVTIGKVQVSSALELGDPRDAAARARLARFDEPRFLHQVRVRRPDGRVEGTRDLDEALAGGLALDGSWRVHFHVPVDATEVAGVATTRPHLERGLAALAGATRHYEVETYTWSVMPPGSGPDEDDALVDALARELRWAAAHIEGAA